LAKCLNVFDDGYRALSKNMTERTLNLKEVNMLNFAKKAFRNFIEVILWINLILSIIAGGVAGNLIGSMISYRNQGSFAFLGVIIGLIMGGFIATILNIDTKIEITYNWFSRK
jgi:F0F1-type ATP synthase assembly protein I